jgi:hypothetical protein
MSDPVMVPFAAVVKTCLGLLAGNVIYTVYAMWSGDVRSTDRVGETVLLALMLAALLFILWVRR